MNYIRTIHTEMKSKPNNKYKTKTEKKAYSNKHGKYFQVGTTT